MKPQILPAIGWIAAVLISLVSGQPAIGAPLPYNCLTRERFSPEKQAWCDRWQIVQTATLIVPVNPDSDSEYTAVTLENGRYRQEDGQFFVELANDANWISFGDINGDGKTDAAIIFGVASDPAGRAIGTYLTVILNIDGAAQPILPIRLGDRILLNGPIAIQPNRIVVPFLTQTEAFDRVYELNLTLRQVP